jgi:hypothetical protein
MKHTEQTHIIQAAHAVLLTKQALDDDTAQLSHTITESLRAMRVQALNQPVRAAAPAQPNRFTAWLQKMPRLSKSIISLPLLGLAIFIAMNNNGEPKSTHIVAKAPVENAELNVDAILNEKIPLQAYLDADFGHYLAQTQQAAASHAANVSFQPRNNP